MTSILINFKTIVVLIKFNDLIRLHSISPIDRIYVFYAKWLLHFLSLSTKAGKIFFSRKKSIVKGR